LILPTGNVALRAFAAEKNMENFVVFWSVVKKYKDQFALKGASPILIMICDELLHTYMTKGSEEYLQDFPLSLYKSIEKAIHSSKLAIDTFDEAQMWTEQKLQSTLSMDEFLNSKAYSDSLAAPTTR